MAADNIKDRQINAIVGAALRALIETGADDEAVGAFAITHRNSVARILGQPEETLATPDLQSVVYQALRLAMEEAGFKPRRSKGKTTQRLNVEIFGRRTSLSISDELLVRLIEAKGNKKTANKFVQEIARNVPNGTENRSAWVEQRIKAFLDFGSSDTLASFRH